jgi:carboxylesterase type B
VHLPDGIIRGKQSTTNRNRTFYSFLKVPYASPPIGDLRFKVNGTTKITSFSKKKFQPPVPPKRWDGILDTTDNYVICYQVNRDIAIESEDCLYLNIYTPEVTFFILIKSQYTDSF